MNEVIFELTGQKDTLEELLHTIIDNNAVVLESPFGTGKSTLMDVAYKELIKNSRITCQSQQ